MNDVDRERDSVSARLLFRYITVDEWRDYRAVMTTFAGTFFAELTPEDVHRRLTANGFTIDPGVIADRLESLRRWGNLTVSYPCQALRATDPRCRRLAALGGATVAKGAGPGPAGGRPACRRHADGRPDRRRAAHARL